MKKVTFLTLIITSILFISIVLSVNPLVANTMEGEEGAGEKSLNVLTCEKSQADIVSKILTGNHNIDFLCNEGIEGKEIKDIDLFLYSNSSNVPKVNEIISKVSKYNANIVNVNRGIRGISSIVDDKTIENPNYLLGLEEYKLALYNTKVALQEKDPVKRHLYEKNYNDTLSYIDKILKEYKDKEELLKNYTFISLDDNLDYFYRSLGINVIKVTEEELLENNNENAILLIEENSEVNIEGYNVCYLLSDNKSMDTLELILENYKRIFSKIDNSVLDEKNE